MKYLSHHLRSRRTDTRGFTVVETMIVLAVAGIILMIVLLAIPALERGSRNDERRQDVQGVLEAVSHYRLNNTGALPSDDTYLQYTTLHIYDTSDITRNFTPSGTVAAQHHTNNSASTIVLYNYAKCSTTTPGGSTNAGAGYSDVVALYGIETANGSAPQCQQL
ncbi:MAG TPA: prepilin-type N-terminal cleavage/methylation domain-containing protein [Candidatus Saccharimonadales bacterium]|nr:prepilin-type N-terminal cleavage/methylation domain-containing protein [Candidatus Saccharimonadales bacterium]